MSQRFYKGRNTNHLTFALVDSTDFATPESALSAAAKLKIYGKLRSDDTVRLVSSGTGSLTNDLKHVGASVLGLYTIGLVKADLSDASAAWYDQYIVSISAAGAAYQALVCEGVIDDSAISALISDIQSAVLVVQSMASDAASAAQQGNSRVLLVQSLASDAHSAAAQTNSRVLLNQSRISDIASYLVVMSGIQSDIYSALSDMQSDFQSRVPKRVATDSQLSDMASDLKSAIAGVTATLGASDISDIASAVNDILASRLSDILSAAVQVNSRVLVGQSYLSDIRSHISDLQSDFQSRVPKRVATDSQLSDLASDLKSTIGGIAITLSASDISDIASAVAATAGLLTTSEMSDIASQVWAHAVGARVDSRILVGQSYLSDIRSHVSDLQSDFQSRVPKRVATDSQLSDVQSDLRSLIVAGVGLTTALMSDLSSRVWTDAAGAAVASRVLLAKSSLSDIYSLLSDVQSDFQSRVPKRVATDSQLSDMASDVKSAVGVGNSRALQASSRILVAQSMVSDLQSVVSDLQSDFQSRVPKRVATDSQLSDLASDLRSMALVNQSVASDILSVVNQVTSTGWGKLAAHTAAVLKAVIAAGSTTTSIVLNTLTGIDGAAPSAVNDFYNGRVLIFTSGALAGQATSISDYVGATVTLTVVALTSAPSAADTAVIV